MPIITMERSKRNPIAGLSAVKAFLLLILALSITSCATQSSTGTASPPGFFYGLLHGFLIMFSVIGSLFADIRIYAYPNTGWLYDFGFFIGAMMILGGGGAGTKKTRKKKKKSKKDNREKEEKEQPGISSLQDSKD